MSTGERRHNALRGHDNGRAVARRAAQESGDRAAAGRPGRQWLSFDDFCDELGVARSTAYKWSSAGPASGRFPRCRRLPNGQLRIRRDWLEEWLDGLPTV